MGTLAPYRSGSSDCEKSLFGIVTKETKSPYVCKDREPSPCRVLGA